MREALVFAERSLAEERAVCIFTPNAEIAQLALENEDVMHLMNGADLLLPDGAGILLASEILKTPLTEKVAGVDFGMGVLSLASEKGYPVFLLGGKPTVVETAAEKLKTKFPALQIVGTHDGYFEKTGAENDAVLHEINTSGAEVLFVCLGAPAQEKWLCENKEKLENIRLTAGLGGSLDVFAGVVKRAPKLFIKLKLEWFYRLIKEPRRIGRMMKLPKYILGAYREKAKNSLKN
jgi:N-acetylglucosaminyldiphosphoundecaprenol N-acetyl-beta-D-mannosaminyltransferase